MKKFTLFLSAMTMAAGAFAAAPEVGGHYVIKNNRGGNYLAYDANGLVHERIADYTTHLYRTGDVAANCIWTVSAGSAEGTVVLKNYTADTYLVAFTDEMSNTIDGTTYTYVIANTADAAVDLSITECANFAGAYSISIANTEGNVSIDADNWNNTFCGNWIPNDGGTAWFFTAIDLEEGDVEKALFTQVVAVDYIDQLNAYIDAVPAAVKAELVAGIEAIEALTGEDATAAKAAEVKNAAMEAAAEALALGLNDKVFAIKNARRAAMELAGGSFLTTDVAQGKFVNAESYDADQAHFTFKAANGGYKICNVATGSYIGEGSAITTDEAAAVVVYPYLAKGGAYYGVSMPFAADHTGQGLNIDTNGNPLTTWSCTDAGSIWSLIDVEEDAIESIEAEKTPAPAKKGIFDLQGRQLAVPVRGINIIDGVKVYVK